jgi:hypothetical protein
VQTCFVKAIVRTLDHRHLIGEMTFAKPIDYLIAISSISKINVAPGPMSAPAPRSP